MSVDKRRFPRITLGDLLDDLRVINEAVITEAKEESTHLEVMDLSYDSLAFKKNPKIEISTGDQFFIALQLAGYPKQVFEVKVVRTTKEVIAVQLLKVSAEQRLVLENFLKDKMIGHNTYLVAKEFYSKKENFTHWFHGPNSTNIIIWRVGTAVSKAVFEMDNDILFFENGRWTLNESEKTTESPEPPEGMSQLEYHIQMKDKGNDDSASDEEVSRYLFERALNIVGQMLLSVPPHQRTVLQFLVTCLKEKLEEKS